LVEFAVETSNNDKSRNPPTAFSLHIVLIDTSELFVLHIPGVTAIL